MRSKAADWTRRWLKRREKARAEDKTARFTWPIHQKKRLNQWLLPALKRMTGAHCTYCDAFPVEVISIETIDHFRPKSRDAFAPLAFEWSNLFYACTTCQGSKRERFEEALLKPDEPGYRFGRYFVYQPDTGKLAPRPGLSEEDRHRVERTIALLGLNAHGRPTHRKRVFSGRGLFGKIPKDERSYRYLFEYHE